MLSFTKSKAFRRFQEKVGNSTFHINACFIGLELIARGARKPDDLNVSFQHPNNPRQQTDQSKTFVHNALIAQTFTALDTYLRQIARDDLLSIELDARSKASKSISKTGGKAYTLIERFEAVLGAIDCDGEGFDRFSADQALVALLTIWRNQNNHEEEENTRLSSDLERLLTSSETIYRAVYGGLEPLAMIENLTKKKSPSRKETVAMVSAANNYVRFIDKKVIESTFSSEHDLEVHASRCLALALLKPTDRQLRVTWGKNEAARQRKITSILEEASYTSGEGHLRLRTVFLTDLAKLSVGQALSYFTSHL